AGDDATRDQRARGDAYLIEQIRPGQADRAVDQGGLVWMRRGDVSQRLRGGLCRGCHGVLTVVRLLFSTKQLTKQVLGRLSYRRGCDPDLRIRYRDLRRGVSRGNTRLAGRESVRRVR